MWTRKQLKTEAKEFLRKHYWKAFLVCLIVAILTGGSGSNSKDNPPAKIENGEIVTTPIQDAQFEINILGRNIPFSPTKNPFVFTVSATAVALIVIAFFIFSIIVGNVIQVGGKKFFIDAYKGYEPRVSTVLDLFKDKNWGPVAWSMFKLGLVIFGWFLLFIIPGIIKSYQYRFVPYILAEAPKMPLSEACAISKTITDNQKMEMFVLDLSFLGWYLLGALLFGIGILFVNPYVEATWAKLYQFFRYDFAHPVGEEQQPILNDDYVLVE